MLLTKEGGRGPGYGVMLCARFPDITLRLLSLFRGASADGLAGVRVRGNCLQKTRIHFLPHRAAECELSAGKVPHWMLSYHALMSGCRAVTEDRSHGLSGLQHPSLGSLHPLHSIPRCDITCLARHSAFRRSLHLVLEEVRECIRNYEWSFSAS